MFKPKIGLSMLYCLSEPFNKMVERLRKVETSYIEIVDEGLHTLDKRRVQILNDLASSRNLKYTVHAPFADINIASPTKPLLNAMFKRLKKSMVHASALDCQVWVFHSGLRTGISSFYPGRDWLQNLESTRELNAFASDLGLKIAVENTPKLYSFLMSSVEEFKRFYSEMDEDIGMVLDIGHANINGQTEKFLKAFPDRIVHMHAHDNDGKNDLHWGIGYGETDWDRVAKAIKSIKYNRIIVVESVEHVEESVRTLKRLLG